MSIGGIVFFVLMAAIFVACLVIAYRPRKPAVIPEPICLGPNEIRYRGVLYREHMGRWYDVAIGCEVTSALELRFHQARREYLYRACQHVVQHAAMTPGPCSHEEHLRAHAEVLRER